MRLFIYFFLLLLAPYLFADEINWISPPFENNFDETKIKNFVSYVFDESSEIKTDSVLVLRNGNLIFEKYARGYDQNTKHRVWSMSKSVAAIVFGIAESQGLVNKEDFVSKYFPEIFASFNGIDRQYKEKIQLKHLLNMSSGIEWKEGYESSPIDSNVVEMLYLDGQRDMGQYYLRQPSRQLPGLKFCYSSGSTNLLMAILKKVVPQYDNYPWDSLFNPLGMKNITWEQDGSGTFIGSSYMHATPRELIKVGQLMLNKGLWNGKRIIPEYWYDYLTQLPPVFSINYGPTPCNKSSYGAHFWLNVPAPKLGIAKPYPSAPSDMFQALGHDGQSLFIIPSMKMVILRMAIDQKNGIDRDKFLNLLIRSLKEMGESEI